MDASVLLIQLGKNATIRDHSDIGRISTAKFKCIGHRNGVTGEER